MTPAPQCLANWLAYCVGQKNAHPGSCYLEEALGSPNGQHGSVLRPRAVRKACKTRCLVSAHLSATLPFLRKVSFHKPCPRGGFLFYRVSARRVSRPVCVHTLYRCACRKCVIVRSTAMCGWRLSSAVLQPFAWSGDGWLGWLEEAVQAGGQAVSSRGNQAHAGRPERSFLVHILPGLRKRQQTERGYPTWDPVKMCASWNLQALGLR